MNLKKRGGDHTSALVEEAHPTESEGEQTVMKTCRPINKKTYLDNV
jgi:hypothetical protein